MRIESDRRVGESIMNNHGEQRSNTDVAGDLWRRARIARDTLHNPRLANTLYEKAFAALRNGRK